MNGVTPDAFGRSTSAPCASSARTTSLSKVWAARSSGVAPVVSRSSRKRLSRPPRLGSLKASCAFGFTPASSSALMNASDSGGPGPGAAVLPSAHRHRHVERRAAPPVPGMRVGAALEQVVGHLRRAVVERHDHRRHAVGVRPVLVGAGLDHRLHAAEASRARRVEERRQAAGRAILHARLVADLRRPVVGLRADREVGALRHQERHHLGMALRRRPHHRGLVAVPLARVDVGALPHQQLGHRDIAGARRQHQRRLPVFVGHVGVGAGFEQHPGQLRVGHPDRLGQRARAVAVDDVGSGALSAAVR